MTVCDHEFDERTAACADGYCPLCLAAEIERLRAEIERLQAALRQCSDDLADEIEARYPLSHGDTPGRDAYPDMQRCYDRDMSPVRTAWVLLDGYEQKPDYAQELVDQAQELNMGYGPNKLPDDPTR